MSSYLYGFSSPDAATGPPAYLASTSLAGSHLITTGTTPAIDTTGAKGICVAVSEYAVTVGAVAITDIKGNVYTACNSYDDGTSKTTLFYCENPVVGAGHTFTYTSVLTKYWSIAVAAYSGTLQAASLNKQNGGTGGDPISTGSVTPDTANQLLIACASFYNGGVPITSINGGFTIRQNVPYTANVNFGVCLADLVQSAAAPANPAFTGDGNGAAQIATFKAAA